MNFLIVLLVCLAFSAVGFHMYIYFFSVGYGLAVAATGAALLVMFGAGMSGPQTALAVMFMVYGLRLSGYLFIREKKSSAYGKVLSPELERSRRMKLGPKLAIWISCALLYALEAAPVLFRLQNAAPDDAALYAGLALMISGLLLETAADMQKTRAKRKAPYRFVSSGLFAVVRCPNYLGEMIFWLGVLVSGVTALSGAWQWVASILGFVLIVYVMFSGARRLEIRQDRNYGSDPEYIAYCGRVPILLPFVPLYSVKKYKFLCA